MGNVQLRGEAHFDVAYALGIGILGQLKGGPLEVLMGLQYTDRKSEAGQVFREVRIAFLEEDLV
jgi:hypothetical protein